MLLQRLRGQTISQRLRTSLCIIDTNPTRLVRLWQLYQGNTPLAVICFFLAVLLVGTTTNSNVPKSDRFMNLFTVAAYLFITESALFWSRRRSRAEGVVKSMIAASEQIESICSEEELSRMQLAAGIAKTLCNSYYSTLCCSLVFLASYPLIEWRNLAAFPTIGNSTASFWVMYFIVTPPIAMGSMSAASFFAYFLQTCICLTALYQALQKEVEICSSNDRCRHLLSIHKALLDITYRLRDLLDRTCFVAISTCLFIMVSNTAYFLEVYRANLVPNIILNFGSIFMLCALGEQITGSCAKVGDAAYGSGWITASLDFKLNVLVIITKSSKLVYLKAGIIGPMRVILLTEVMKVWYRILQALVNLA